jgi:hypothetical protein
MPSEKVPNSLISMYSQAICTLIILINIALPIMSKWRCKSHPYATEVITQ